MPVFIHLIYSSFIPALVFLFTCSFAAPVCARVLQENENMAKELKEFGVHIAWGFIIDSCQLPVRRKKKNVGESVGRGQKHCSYLAAVVTGFASNVVATSMM